VSIENWKDVHTEHCCILHGCKYGNIDNECTVAEGLKDQSDACEDCDWDGLKTVEEVKRSVSYSLENDGDMKATNFLADKYNINRENIHKVLLDLMSHACITDFYQAQCVMEKVLSLRD
jgi:hypothetical protein